MKNHKKQLEIMQYYQRWRRGEEDMMKHTAQEIGIAIDYCISATVDLPVACKAAVNMAGEIHRFRSEMGKAHGFKK